MDRERQDKDLGQLRNKSRRLAVVPFSRRGAWSRDQIAQIEEGAEAEQLPSRLRP
jgi:hypothetical protein